MPENEITLSILFLHNNRFKNKFCLEAKQNCHFNTIMPLLYFIYDRFISINELLLKVIKF